MNSCLLVSKDKDDFYHRISHYLAGLGIRRVTEPPADFSIVLGGDGTVLGAARNGLESPVVVINTGTLGFLTSSTKRGGLDVIDRVLLGEYSVSTRNLLNLTHQNNSLLALNNITVRAHNENKLIHVALYGQDETGDGDEVLIADYRADGIIIATPTGSTAYSLSASGPIVHPACRSFVITPICPQGLTQRPLVLPYTYKLRVKPMDQNLFVSVDGQDGIPVDNDFPIFIRYGSSQIQTVNPIMNYFEVLQHKLGWGTKPVQNSIGVER